MEVEVVERSKKGGREKEFTSRRKLCTMGQRQPRGRQAKSKKAKRMRSEAGNGQQCGGRWQEDG